MVMYPTVSIVIPCYNEEATIGLVLAALYQQTYPRGRLEVVIADGRSSDRTLDKISEFQNLHPDLRIAVVDHPQRIIPSAVNTAISASTGEVIVRLDGHSVPDASYVEVSVRDLLDGKGDNVGGIWLVQPGAESWLGRSIAVAGAHPMGVGDAMYRYASQAHEVDTVPFGAFYRSTFERIGLFDEKLLSNEDYEWNVRLRNAGGKVYLDPAIHSNYFARANLPALARQYWRYGYWKFRMLKRYPGSLRWRQALPPLFVAGMAALILASPFWQFARILLLAVSVFYLLVLLAGSVPAAIRGRDLRLMIGIPLAIMSMHFAWGAGFLYSIFTSKG